MKVKIGEVFLDPHRQRSKVDQGKIAELAMSIQSHGLIHPITIAPLDRVRFPDAPQVPYQLVAGYRRLLAHAFMKVPEIDANFREDLNRLELEEIELDENIMREELPWQDAVAAKARIMELRSKLYGDGVREVADHLGEAKTNTWEDVRLARAMEVMPELKNSKNKTQAQNKLRLLLRRQEMTELAEKLNKQAGIESSDALRSFEFKIKLGDCLELSKGWNSGIASCVITDPPYGISLDVGETKKGSPHPTIYADDSYDIMDLTARVAKEAFRLLKENAHAYFFFDIKSYPKVFRALTEAGFTVEPIPLVWVKPGPGQVNHPDTRWGSGYEACFFCRKGALSLLKQGQSNVLTHDPVPANRKIHPVEKPVALIRQLLETSTVPGDLVIDFFGGSGSTAEACLQTGRNFLIAEKDPAYHAGIMDRLRKVTEAQLAERTNSGPNKDSPQSKYDPLGGEDESEEGDAA